MMEETIELKALMEIILKRKWLILILTVFCAISSVLYTKYMITPQYESDTTLMVNGNKGMSAADIASSFDLGSINLNQKLVVTYGEIVKSRIVLEQVISNLGLDLTYTELYNKIISSPVKSTEILRITVKDESPEMAAQIANKTAEVFVKEVMRILKVNNVETIDRAIPHDKAINVKLKLNVAVAMVLGIMLGVFIAFAMAYLDQSLNSEEEVKRHLGLNVIGVIPDYDRVKDKK